METGHSPWSLVTSSHMPRTPLSLRSPSLHHPGLWPLLWVPLPGKMRLGWDRESGLDSWAPEVSFTGRCCRPHGFSPDLQLWVGEGARGG